MSKCEWKECMEKTIDELKRINIPGKQQGDIKNKFIGLLKKLKAIESKPQRGGTEIIKPDGTIQYKCDY